MEDRRINIIRLNTFSFLADISFLHCESTESARAEICFPFPLYISKCWHSLYSPSYSYSPIYSMTQVLIEQSEYQHTILTHGSISQYLMKSARDFRGFTDSLCSPLPNVQGEADIDHSTLTAVPWRSRVSHEKMPC